MKREEIPMGNRMIQILNRIIEKFEDFRYVDENLQYCKIIKKRLEKEVENSK